MTESACPDRVAYDASLILVEELLRQSSRLDKVAPHTQLHIVGPSESDASGIVAAHSEGATEGQASHSTKHPWPRSEAELAGCIADIVAHGGWSTEAWEAPYDASGRFPTRPLQCATWIEPPGASWGERWLRHLPLRSGEIPQPIHTCWADLPWPVRIASALPLNDWRTRPVITACRRSVFSNSSATAALRSFGAYLLDGRFFDGPLIDGELYTQVSMPSDQRHVVIEAFTRGVESSELGKRDYKCCPISIVTVAVDGFPNADRLIILFRDGEERGFRTPLSLSRLTVAADSTREDIRRSCKRLLPRAFGIAPRTEDDAYPDPRDVLRSGQWLDDVWSRRSHARVRGLDAFGFAFKRLGDVATEIKPVPVGAQAQHVLGSTHMADALVVVNANADTEAAYEQFSRGEIEKPRLDARVQANQLVRRSWPDHANDLVLTLDEWTALRPPDEPGGLVGGFALLGKFDAFVISVLRSEEFGAALREFGGGSYAEPRFTSRTLANIEIPVPPPELGRDIDRTKKAAEEILAAVRDESDELDQCIRRLELELTDAFRLAAADRVGMDRHAVLERLREMLQRDTAEGYCQVLPSVFRGDSPEPADAPGLPPPAPIAICDHLMQSTLDAGAKFSLAFDLAEVIARLDVAILVAAVASVDPQAAPDALRLVFRGRDFRPSFGDWVALGRELHAHAERLGERHAVLRAVSPNGWNRAYKGLKQLVQRRNETKGHGFTPTSHKMTEWTDETLRESQAARSELGYIDRVLLAALINQERRRNEVLVNQRVLMGSELPFRVRELVHPPGHPWTTAIAHEVHAELPGTEQPVSLWPFVVLAPGPDGKDRVWLLNKLDRRGTAVFQSPGIETEHTDDDAGKQLQTLLRQA